jgi:hypothetical protein
MDKKELDIQRRRIMSMSEKRKEAFKFFERVLTEKHSVDEKNFFIKLPFYSNKVEVIALFESELRSDFFVELYTTDLKPFHQSRILFKWTHHKHLEEYRKIEKTDTVSTRYLIPTNELIEVSTYIEDDFFNEDHNDDDEFYSGEDLPINENTIIIEEVKLTEMTSLDLYAIIHKKPVSKNEKINNLIKKYE